MKKIDEYEDLDGNRIILNGVDEDERRLIGRLRRRARTHPDWCDFDNYWMRVVPEFYDARGLSRKKATNTIPFRIAQDLSGRLGIAQGYIRQDDYRDDLEDLIRTQFKSRRAFCNAAGISEETLNHLLAGRKDLSLPHFNEALARIGYRLRILPTAEQKRTT